jgi:hypothetical protein
MRKEREGLPTPAFWRWWQRCQLRCWTRSSARRPGAPRRLTGKELIRIVPQVAPQTKNTSSSPSGEVCCRQVAEIREAVVADVFYQVRRALRQAVEPWNSIIWCCSHHPYPRGSRRSVPSWSELDLLCQSAWI